MMFLLRTAFWVSVGLALLPSFVSRQGTAVPPPVGTADAVTAASEAVADLSGFCERRPDACAVGLQFANAFGQRAQAGAKILYDFVGDRIGKSEAPSPAGVITSNLHPVTTGNAADTASSDAARPSQHNLTATDLAPTWRGPPHRKEAPAKRTS